MVIGTSRCAHVLRYLFCCRVGRAARVRECSTTAEVSGEPVMRNARTNARRRIAACRHCWSGCSHAPRPGRLPAVSTVTAHSPFPSDSDHPKQFDGQLSFPASHTRPHRSTCGSAVRRASEAEVSRWITAQSTVTAAPNRQNRVVGDCYRSRAARCGAAASGRVRRLAAGAASLRMSMRHPVSRAASRAFCPSLPIASDSWKSGTTTRAARACLVDDATPTPPWPVTARWPRTGPGPRRSR